MLAPITREDIRDVASFLHATLNSRISAADWASAMVPTWSSPAPNHGFLLRSGDDVVGAGLAFYSERVVDGEPRPVCNLGAWSVVEEHRAHGLRLLRALLGQRGYDFTDLSPSGNVVALNERLKFQHLDTTTALVPNVPRPARGVRLVTDPADIERVLDGDDLRIFLDHRDAAAARHLVLQADGRQCYVIVRKDRRRGIPLFATVLHASDPDLLPRVGARLYTHLLVRHGAVATLAELRVVGRRPRFSRLLASPRPKMFRSQVLAPQDIDYLYSELTCVAW